MLLDDILSKSIHIQQATFAFLVQLCLSFFVLPIQLLLSQQVPLLSKLYTFQVFLSITFQLPFYALVPSFFFFVSSFVQFNHLQQISSSFKFWIHLLFSTLLEFFLIWLVLSMPLLLTNLLCLAIFLFLLVSLYLITFLHIPAVGVHFLGFQHIPFLLFSFAPPLWVWRRFFLFQPQQLLFVL